jgi:hypothetical protein
MSATITATRRATSLKACFPRKGSPKLAERRPSLPLFKRGGVGSDRTFSCVFV